jgi:hypothetical protein
MPNPIYVKPNKQILPTPNDKTQAGLWGNFLNDYLKQSTASDNGGGLNTFTADPLGKLANDLGYTYINSSTNQIRRWDGTTFKTILDSAGGSNSQEITLGYEVGAATAGTSFDSNINGGVSIVLLPATTPIAKIDPSTIMAKIHKGVAPVTDTLVKIQKKGTTDCITYTIPANATSATVLTPVNIGTVTFVNGDNITCNLSQACPGLDFGTYFSIIKA